MVFSSITFLFLFLPFFLTLYFLAGKKLRNLVLLSANFIFYAWGEKGYALILLTCIIANYLFGIAIQKSRKNKDTSFEWRRFYLIAAIAFNLGLLLYYKYLNFIVENINLLTSSAIHIHKLHLPLGISFFVFQALSYVIDVYRRDAKATANMVDFAVYKSLFPQLIAGPIVRYRDVAGQIVERRVSAEGFNEGVKRFIVGLGKKVLIANTLAKGADQIFAMPVHELGSLLAWLGAICYTLQIYFDFSGYSDMAIGLGKMLGFDFLENFNYPYISRSVQEFWRRWHISLSTWFRDYVYFPLGGNRRGPFRNYYNLLVVFFLCGLWHGASWTFVIWGMWHGLFLALERTAFRSYLKALGGPIAYVYTMLVVIIGWVFFRSPGFDYALGFILAMFDFSKTGLTAYQNLVFINWEFLLALFAGILFSCPVSELHQYLFDSFTASNGLALNVAGKCTRIAQVFLLSAIFLFSAMALASGTYNPFIYFRF